MVIIVATPHPASTTMESTSRSSTACAASCAGLFKMVTISGFRLGMGVKSSAVGSGERGDARGGAIARAPAQRYMLSQAAPRFCLFADDAKFRIMFRRSKIHILFLRAYA